MTIKGVTFHPSDAGLQEWMKDNLTDKIRDVADQVATNAQQHTSEPVNVEMGETDRPRAVVAIASARGIAEQARTGALTRGAAASGLEVKAGGSESGFEK